MSKVNHENISKYIQDKFGAGAKAIGKLDSNKIVVRTGSGATTTFNEADVSNHIITQPNRDKQQHMKDLSAQAKQNNQIERMQERDRKQQAQDKISKEVQAMRDRRDSENKLSTDYRV